MKLDAEQEKKEQKFNKRKKKCCGDFIFENEEVPPLHCSFGDFSEIGSCATTSAMALLSKRPGHDGRQP